MDIYVGILEKTVRELIKEKEEYKDFELKYILINNNDYRKTEAVFSDEAMQETIILYVFDGEKIIKIPEWNFNYDEYIYEKLANGYQIGLLSDDIHYSIWNDIDMNYPEYIENLSGVRKYIEYCKEKGINREYLETKFAMKVPDIMERFEKADYKAKKQDRER